MKERPCIFLEFDPVTFELIAIFFKASTDRETEQLREILFKNFKEENPEGYQYDA